MLASRADRPIEAPLRRSEAASRPRAFELVMWENACYLLSDERRAAVFEGRARKWASIRAILNADRDILLALARMGGMRRNRVSAGARLHASP